MHRLDAAAQLHPVEAAKARPLPLAELLDDAGGGERLVVAGVVEQARGDVDGVAEDVARHLDHLALRQPDLELQRDRRPRWQRRRAAVAGFFLIDLLVVRRFRLGLLGHADARHRVVHVVGGGDAFGRRLEHRHQAVAERLHDLAAVGGDDPGEEGDAARDDGRRVGIAERLVHRGAAAQVGEQHGALQNLGHAGAVERAIGREFIASTASKRGSGLAAGTPCCVQRTSERVEIGAQLVRSGSGA